MKRTLCLLLPVLLLVVGLFLFLRPSEKPYRRLIPREALAVVAFRPASVASALRLPWRQRLLLRAALRGRRVYGFVAPDGTLGLAAPSLSPRLLERWLGKEQIQMSESDGIRWAVVRQWILAFDDRRLLVMEPSASRQQMLGLMKSTTEPAELLALARQQRGMAGLAAYADKPLLRRLSLPPLFGRGEVMACGALTEEADTLLLDLDLQPLTPKSRKLFQTARLMAQPLPATLSELPPGKPYLNLRLNPDGEQLLALLRRYPRVRTALLGINLLLDADLMIRSIQGDAQLTFPYPRPDAPCWLFTAQLRDTTCFSRAADWQANTPIARVEALSPSDFFLSIPEFDAYFGHRGSRLYVASHPFLVNEPSNSREEATAEASVPPGSRLHGRFLFGAQSPVGQATLNIFEGPKIQIKAPLKWTN